MKKIKDIFYDLNDVLVALVIVAVAAFVIVHNIDTIITYPSIAYDEIQNSQSSNQEVPSDQQDSGDGGDTSDNEGTKNVEPVKYSIYIKSGSTGEKIADTLISVGLFESRQEFLDAVTAAGAEGKLKAGNFTIPSDATPAEIVSIITK